jgi:hypothetical protein
MWYRDDPRYTDLGCIDNGLDLFFEVFWDSKYGELLFLNHEDRNEEDLIDEGELQEYPTSALDELLANLEELRKANEAFFNERDNDNA